MRVRERKLLGCQACIPHATIDYQIHLDPLLRGDGWCNLSLHSGEVSSRRGRFASSVKPDLEQPIRMESHD